MEPDFGRRWTDHLRKQAKANDNLVRPAQTGEGQNSSGAASGSYEQNISLASNVEAEKGTDGLASTNRGCVFLTSIA